MFLNYYTTSETVYRNRIAQTKYDDDGVILTTLVVATRVITVIFRGQFFYLDIFLRSLNVG